MSITTLAKSPPKAAEPRRSAVPAPRRRWLWRVALPATLIAGLAAGAAALAMTTLVPATEVEGVRVVARPISETAPSTAAPRSSRADVGPAARGAVIAQAPGWVEPRPYYTAATTLTMGVVETVHVLEGDAVSAGDPLVSLVADDAELELAEARANLSRQQASLQRRRAELAAAEANWQHPIELSRMVATSAAGVAEAKAELDRLPAEIAAQEARVRELAEDVRRLRELARREGATAFELAVADAKLTAAEATLLATRQREAILQAKLDRLQAEQNAAEESLSLRIVDRRALDDAKAAVAEAEAAVALAENRVAVAALRVERMVVRAPIDGVVLQRLVEPGSKLTFGSDNRHSAHAMHLYDPQKLQVRVDVPLADAAGVRIGQPAEIVVDVLPDRTFAGEVIRVEHRADLNKNTVQFKVAIVEPDEVLKPDMLSRVKVFQRASKPADAGEGGSEAVASASTATFAPHPLLSGGGETRTAFVLDRKTGTAQRRSVTVADRSRGPWIRVVEGLNPGEVVLDARSTDLSDGQRVRVVGEPTDLADALADAPGDRLATAQGAN